MVRFVGADGLDVGARARCFMQGTVVGGAVGFVAGPDFVEEDGVGEVVGGVGVGVGGGEVEEEAEGVVHLVGGGVVGFGLVGRFGILGCALGGVFADGGLLGRDGAAAAYCGGGGSCGYGGDGACLVNAGKDLA